MSAPMTMKELGDLPLSLYERCMKWLDGEDGANAYRCSDLAPFPTTIKGSVETKDTQPAKGKV